MAGETMTECTVGDIAAASRNAIVGGPFGSDLVSRDYEPSGVPVIRGANMGLGRWVDGEFVYVSPAKAESLASNCAKPGDLVFTQRGTLGQVALVPKKGAERYLISQSQMKVTLDPKKADALFIYYVFISSEQQAYIRQNAIQTGVPHTNLGILRNTPLTLPPLAEQRAIASVLGALDDKIELNRRMNATLESMARALFQSWFIDFDPVRAKLDNRHPTGMDAETSALFPDRFEDSEFGKIPLGWTVTDIGSFAINHDARREPVKENQRKPGPYPYYGASGIVDHVDGYLFDGEFLLVAEDGENLRTRKTPVAFRATGQFWVNNHAHVITGPTLGGTRFLMLTLERADIGGYLTGSTIPKLSQQSMNRISFVLPSSELLDVFEQITSPMFERIDWNEHNSNVLATLRDTLLPKLLSGELSVAGLEARLEIPS